MIPGARHVERIDQCAASVGVIVNDVKSEVSVATATVRPNSLRIFPSCPGKNAIGTKTTTSTSVTTTAASPISSRPLRAAVIAFSPIARCRSMFSRTTIESSTRIPMTSVIAMSEMVSSVKPMRYIAPSVIPSDVGIASMTTTALRQEPRKKTMTIDVSTMPSSSVWVTTLMSCSVCVADTFVTSNATAGNSFRKAGSSASVALATWTSLAPADLITLSVTPPSPSNVEYERTGS